MDKILQEIAQFYKGQGAPGDQAALLSCLREAQAACGGMLDGAAQAEIGQVLGVKPSYLQAVAKCISDLKLSGAAHTLTVCQGQNCTRRGAEIRRYLEAELGARPGKTFLDGKWLYQTAGCQRACRTSPNVRVDGRLITGVTVEKLKELLQAK